MTKKISRAVLLACIAVLLLSFSAVLGFLYDYFGGVTESQLEAELDLAAQGVERAGMEYLAALEDPSCRVTWVDGDGVVLFDTQAPAETLENHGDREEIREALASGRGGSARYSETLMRKTNYAAKRLSDGTVLRVAASRATAGGLALGMLPPLLFVLAAAVALSVWLSRRAAKTIVEPINDMDLEHPLKNDCYEELSPLMERLDRQRGEIESQLAERARAEQNRREFTANVSHELKTPVQSILGSAELLENNMVAPEDAPRFVSRIRQEASRLVTLIDDIIRLSQLDEGGRLPEETVSLGTLAGEALSALEGEAAKKNVSLSARGDGAVTGARGLLYELIFNLCDNAVKYNVEGGSVRVTVSKTEKGTALSVADTGVGIPPEHQQRVFERFYRVDKSHSRKSGGTGLGLSIVKHAAQYHHAALSLESAPGQGTTVTVVFPR